MLITMTKFNDLQYEEGTRAFQAVDYNPRAMGT